MRKYMVFFLLVILITLPSQFLVTEAAKPAIPALYHTLDLLQTPLANKPENYVDLILAPLGWSKDGKFAYIIGKDPGGAGYEETGYFRWVIQDMVTDKYLWESKNGLEEGIPEGLLDSTDLEKIFAWIYTNFKGKYQAQFDRYKIIIDKNLRLEKFPLLYQQTEYRGAITEISREEKYGFPDMVGKYRVVVTKNSATKTVANYTNIDDCLLDVQMVGYVQSPYEARIAIAIGAISMGWEGPPHTVKCGFVGCHLNKGF
jgi:hypothetical protein